MCELLRVGSVLVGRQLETLTSHLLTAPIASRVPEAEREPHGCQP